MAIDEGTSSPAKLSGKVAVVTGASRGIGRAIAIRLASLGARVVLNYCSNEARAKEALELVLAAGAPGARLFRADIGRVDEAKALIAGALEEEGRVDLLVNNAARQASVLLHKASDADWHDVLNVNLSGVFYLCRAVLPSMLARGSGQIINIASASSFIPHPRGVASYVASKHGLIGLTRALAVETASKGILVNAVAPGVTDTDMIASLTPEQRERILSIVPMKRAASAEEVAAMVAWVASEVTYSTGNVFHVSGGLVMS